MASGKKNYFRHSFHARKHEEIARLIDDHGKEAYFHFFALCEICAERASDKFPDDNLFVFRRSTLCRELLVTNSRLSRHLLVMVPSLVDHIVVTENDAQIIFPKLRKYIGLYDSKSLLNSSNKRKGNEIKINEIKEKEIVVKVSPLSFLFDKWPDVQEWLNNGSHETHSLLVSKFSHHVLAEEIPKLFEWAHKKEVRAESWMHTKLLNVETTVYGANKPKAAFKPRGHGVASTPQNPTGNPYIQEAIEKGYIA